MGRVSINLLISSKRETFRNFVKTMFDSLTQISPISVMTKMFKSVSLGERSLNLNGAENFHSLKLTASSLSVIYI